MGLMSMRQDSSLTALLDFLKKSRIVAIYRSFMTYAKRFTNLSDQCLCNFSTQLLYWFYSLLTD